MPLPIHWLDANVFIDAKNGLYAFDLAPRFWIWLEEKLQSGSLRSSRYVYKEIASSESPKDKLHRWARTRKSSGYWVQPTREVQEKYQELAEYVVAEYEIKNPAKTGEFLAKADVWIIAHALVSRGIVVTDEARVNKFSQTPKIPNVCSHFGVRCITMMDMLRTFKFSLG